MRSKYNPLLIIALLSVMVISATDIHAQVINAPKKTSTAAQDKKKTTVKPNQPKPAAVFKLNGNENDFTLSVEPSGGLVEMNVITNASSYSIDQMPSFCKLQSQMGGTFTIKCEPNNAGNARYDSLVVSVPDGKQITVTLQQGKNVVSSGGTNSSFPKKIFRTIYGITIGKTTFNDMISRGFNRDGSAVTIKEWMGNYAVHCYSEFGDATERVNGLYINYHDETCPLPEEWISAGAPSGNMNYYRWKTFLEQNGFSTTEKEILYPQLPNLASLVLYAENKSIGIKFKIATNGYKRNDAIDPRSPSSEAGIDYVNIEYRW